MLLIQPTLHCSATYLSSLLSSILNYYPSSNLGAKKLFTKYDYLTECNQVLFALTRPNYVINMICKSDIYTELLLPMTSSHPNDSALNSTGKRLTHPQSLSNTVLTQLLEPSGYYMCTASLSFTIQRSAHAVYLRVLYGSENKQQLFPYTVLMTEFYKRDLTL
jgi:hypothetical protein